jgi:hypothetical protein
MNDVTINVGAPVRVSRQVEIAADAEALWDILTDIASWPSWNPDVKEATPLGPLAPGSKFRWKSGPGVITSTLFAVDRPRLIAWTGTTMGIKAVHVWRLEPHQGTTTVHSEESWEGLPVRLMRGSMQRRLEAAIVGGVEALKVAAERTARS